VTYEIALLGATGFTGGLTAEYLADHGPGDLRWAVAGRNRARLDELARRLSARSPDREPVGVIQADMTDLQSLTSLASSARVVATTAGPFAAYGEPLVAACAQAGTDYLDICGESEFVDRMWLLHHERATGSGARLVHSCGFDSVPPDLGVWFTLRHLPEGVPLTVEGFVRAHASISAGTYRSAVGSFAQSRQAAAASAERRRTEPRPQGRSVEAIRRDLRREPGSNRWALRLPTIDPIVVRRSARALDRYGPDFRYGHYASLGGLPTVTGTVGGLVAVRLLARVSPARSALLRLRRTGEGPSAQRRRKSWFRVRFVGTGGGHRVVTEVSGGDPGYDETAKMLAESAICLARDDLPAGVGQLTTVQAMGDALLARLQNAGMTFRVIESSGCASTGR
jgi:saccharopine dehydrogenase (NAD+, L-glutamate forming)